MRNTKKDHLPVNIFGVLIFLLTLSSCNVFAAAEEPDVWQNVSVESRDSKKAEASLEKSDDEITESVSGEITDDVSGGISEKIISQDKESDSVEPEGTTELADGYYQIHSALNYNMVLDIESGSLYDQANAQLYSGNNTDAQIFYLHRNEDNGAVYWTISSLKSGKVLDVAGARTISGTNVQQYTFNNTNAQRWVLTGSASEGYVIRSNISDTDDLVLDVMSGKAINGQNIQVFQANNTKAQKWIITPVDRGTDSNPPVDILQSYKVPAADLEDGDYYIQSALDRTKVIDIANGSELNTANVQLFSINGTKAQIFHVRKSQADGQAYWTLTAANSGKVLDVASGKNKPGTNVQQYQANNTKAQQWIFSGSAEKGYVISSRVSSNDNLVLDVSNGTAGNGANIQIYSANASEAQKWYLKKVAKVTDTLPADIADGYYRISSGAGTDMMLNAANGSEAASANINISTFDGTSAQLYQIKKHAQNGSIWWTITGYFSGKALDVQSGSALDSTNVQQYYTNNSNAQKWYITGDSASGFVIHSLVDQYQDYVLDVSQGIAKNGQNVQIYTANSTPAQRWKLQLVTVKTADIANGIYTIHSAADNNQVLDAAGDTGENGDNIQTFASNGTNAQKWIFTGIGDGCYKVVSASSRLSLDVASASRRNGANVQLYTDNSSNAQIWRILTDPNDPSGNTLIIQSRCSGLVLSKTSDNNNVQTSIDRGENLGRWSFESTTMAPGNLEAGGLFMIVPAGNTGLALDISGASKADQAEVQLNTLNRSASQVFQIVKKENGEVGFKNINSGKMISDAGGTTGNGNVIWQCGEDNSVADQWNLVPTGNIDGSYYIKYSNTDYQMDIPNANYKVGQRVQLFNANGTTAQKFYIIRLTNYKPANVIVMLDPGHDAKHAGATSHGMREENLNYEIAMACKKELETYSGITVIMTHDSINCPFPDQTAGECLHSRLDMAGVDHVTAYVSFHCDISSNAYANGVKTYYQNSNYKPIIAAKSKVLAQNIQDQLVSQGLLNLGIKTRSMKEDTYPDGSLMDYYAVNRLAKLQDIPAVLIEHGFISNSLDLRKLGNSSGRAALGKADAAGIAKYFNLKKK